MDCNLEEVSWLTQQVTQLPSSQDNYWRHPETVPMVRYVYDDEEYVEDVPNQVVIRQRLPDNDSVAHKHVQHGLIDNFNPSQLPLLSLDSCASQYDDQEPVCVNDSQQHTQRFSDLVTADELVNMQRKT